ncbi:MAG: DoxX family protein [Acidimicrobiales bacterium]
MSALTLAGLERFSGLAPLVLRVVTGVVMTYHGWQKLNGGRQGLEMGLLAPKGVPLAGLVSWIVTLIELAGGAMLVVGLLTRLATLPLMGVLVGAIVLAKADAGLIAPRGEGVGFELDLALLAALVAVAVLGPGRPSLDRQLRLD